MTIGLLFLLTLGVINWGYAYPIVFIFVVILRQRLFGREIYFNFLYAPNFWLLLSAGTSYALIGMRTISGGYHHGILPVIAFSIGWVFAEESADESIRDGILALTAGFGAYATLNMLVNIGNERYQLIDFWTSTYRAATGSGSLNTLPISVALVTLQHERRALVRLLFLALLLAVIRYMFLLGTRTQFAILMVVSVLATLQFAYHRQGIVGVIKGLAILAAIALIVFLFYHYNIWSIREYILNTNLAARYERSASLQRSDSFRVHSFWVGLRELFQYPLGGRASQVYRHNMWLDVGRVSGVIPFALLLSYSIRNFTQVVSIWRNKNVLPALRCLLLFLYIGAYINCFVEPIWEGAWNFFLALCVVDGMVNGMMRSVHYGSSPEKSVPNA